MRMFQLAILVSVAWQLGQGAYAQHCAGITESYLSEISIKHVKDTLKIKCEYYKVGGRKKEAYQAYLLAYLDQHANKVNQSGSAEFFDPESVQVLHTQVIQRDEEGVYKLEFAISNEDFVKMMFKKKRLLEEDQSSSRDYYDAKVRLAVFIPFLEDAKYAVLKGLPEDRHECNYRGLKALLFQQLPPSVNMVVTGRGTHKIDLNSNQSAKETTK